MWMRFLCVSVWLQKAVFEFRCSVCCFIVSSWFVLCCVSFLFRFIMILGLLNEEISCVYCRKFLLKIKYWFILLFSLLFFAHWGNRWILLQRNDYFSYVALWSIFWKRLLYKLDVIRHNNEFLWICRDLCAQLYQFTSWQKTTDEWNKTNMSYASLLSTKKLHKEFKNHKQHATFWIFHRSQQNQQNTQLWNYKLDPVLAI